VERLEAMASDIPITSIPCSYKFNWLPKRSFDIICHNRESWIQNKFDKEIACVQCFTDGSNSNDNTGCAFVIYNGNQVLERIFPLGKMCTAYDSEVYAIMQAAYALATMSLSPGRVRIFTDSMSALQAVSKCHTASALVCECSMSLNQLGEKYLFELFWIPAHSGYAGNERADMLAKEAAERSFCGPESALPVSSSCIQGAVINWGFECFNRLWLETIRHRQSKIFLEWASDYCGNSCMTLNKKSLRLVTHIVTGHNLLNSHQTTVKGGF